MQLTYSEPPLLPDGWRIAYRSSPCSRVQHRRPFAAPRGSRIRADAGRHEPQASLYLGLDFGTSGARCIAIDDDANVVAESKEQYGASAEHDLAASWERALWDLLGTLPSEVRAAATAIAVDGTSPTALLVDGRSGAQLAPPSFYTELPPADVVEAVKAFAPEHHFVTAPTSSLCKAAAWDASGVLREAREHGAEPRILHHADWVASLLHGRRDASDWHNALKLGFDPGAEAYPDWLLGQPYADVFPTAVLRPGAAVANVSRATAERTGLNPACTVCAGTTDSIAAFLAAAVSEPGAAVTSLGSSLVVKLLSETRVDDSDYGIYSHRLGDLWLVGGASNTGGAVLRHYFDDDRIRELTEKLDVTRSSGLDYYPLLKPGERCPVNDPQLQPRLSPRPPDDALFLHGLLEGMADIESNIYALLAKLGASPLKMVLTAGGGGMNDKWTQIRAAKLGVPVQRAAQGQAAFGSALLARGSAA